MTLSSSQPRASVRTKALVAEAFVAYLDQHQIPWRECFEIASENLPIYPYQGSIYVDVPYETENPLYVRLAAYLETPDGCRSTLTLPSGC